MQSEATTAAASAVNRYVLQRLVVPGRVETAELYWRHEGKRRGARISADIPAGGALDLDTYFNSFDENVWRQHTTIGDLAVRLAIDGACRVE